MARRLIIVQTPSFMRDTATCLEESDKDELLAYLGADPTSGKIIPQTGGVRKLRWAASGRGKRGGARVIYYFHSEEIPLYLLKFYTKAAKEDLTQDEKKRLRKIVEAIVAEHKRRK